MEQILRSKKMLLWFPSSKSCIGNQRQKAADSLFQAIVSRYLDFLEILQGAIT
jgi:hypothetical protein